jgi:pimeloyl-ACP methyl ester carboxylesterase
MAAAALRRRDMFLSHLDAEANFAAKPPMADFDPAVRRAYVEHGFAPIDPAEPDGPVQLRCRPEVEAETYRMGAAHNTFELLADVRCPVVIARGAVTPGPALFADRIAESLPDGRLLVHEDLSHFGPLEDPARTAGDVAAFLDALGVLPRVPG